MLAQAAARRSRSLVEGVQAGLGSPSKKNARNGDKGEKGEKGGEKIDLGNVDLGLRAGNANNSNPFIVEASSPKSKRA